ncbi:DUF4164 domain-containing protein [Consotaella aegiceratis]|uniref:DUF4164 domain-containing protein n=1 Tax=Consotaella aegiceratis TaxID=3097961 RepID=UPI003D807007
MSAKETLEDATGRLATAIKRLEGVVDDKLQSGALAFDANEELQRMAADRAKLAGQLDAALARGERLEQANREVSKRLVSVMETIRVVLNRHKSG